MPGEHGGVAGRPVHLLLQLLHQRAAVEAVGERIGLRQVPHLLLAHDRVLEIVRLLQRRHGRVDHLLRELHVLLVERRVAVGGAEEEDAGGLLPEREPDRDGRPGRARGRPSDSQTARIPWNSGSVRHVAHQHHLTGGERVLDLGIAAEVHRQVVEHRVLVRRHHRAVVVVRARR